MPLYGIIIIIHCVDIVIYHLKIYFLYNTLLFKLIVKRCEVNDDQ